MRVYGERCPKCDARWCSCDFDQRERDYSSAVEDMDMARVARNERALDRRDLDLDAPQDKGCAMLLLPQCRKSGAEGL